MSEDFHKQTTLPDLSPRGARLPLPQKIGPYKIESVLNRGGMSVLYLGVHPETAQPIAIKVLLPKYLKNKEFAKRFLKEAQIIAMTHHPNIVKLYSQGEWEKGLYIAMEFIRGISLRQFIQQKSLSHKRALEIILQVAYALYHLHSHGVIHRDLKPENILITETGEIKVIDFGIAQLHSELGEERVTQKKRIMGTPIYMSPEQKEHPGQVSYPSDIYSLGIIAYELFLGRLSHGVIHLALLPRSLRNIIEKSLQPNPKDRYPDSVDFINDVSQYLRVLSEEGEEGEIGASDEVLAMIEQTHALLIPKKAPQWPQIEIGIALQEEGPLSSLYLDFFHLPENRYCILLAQPLQSGVASLVHSAILRGMVRMGMEKNQAPLKILEALHHTLHQDPIDLDFTLSFLLLAPEQDQLSFISCGSSDLWHLSEGSETARSLTTPNPALGSNRSSTWAETTDNWRIGDLLILPSRGWEPKEGTDAFHALLSPQPQAEKLLTNFHTKQLSAILSLRRMF